jgi:hypothetical protein
MTAQPNLARAAEYYAAKPWSVFPLAPRDKKPLTEHGLKDATTDLATVSKWWTDHPEANIGLAMGAGSGMFAVDIDGAAGATSLASLESKHGDLPATLEAVTSNGRHLLFKLPSGIEIRNSASRIGEGIDVRGNGGYLVVAPSIHPSNARYQWKGGHRPDQIDAADAPAWLIDLVRKKEPAPSAPIGYSDGNGRMDAYASAALANELAAMASAREGRRNHQLNETAFKLGTLVGAGMIERSTVEAALAGAAAAAGLDRIETERTIKSGIESGIQQPREVPDRQPNEPLHGLKLGGGSAPQPGLNSSNSFNSYQHSSEWPELPDEARHGFVGRLLDVVGPHTEADPVAIIGQMLAGFGAAIGRGPHFTAERDRHGGNIFLVLVGETSKGRKGTSLGYARELIVTADPTLCDRMANGLSSGEGLIDAVRDPIEKQQAVKDGKKTIGFEKVIEDPGISDKRLLVVESEFSSVLKVCTREGNNLSQNLRAAWDGTTLRTMTRNSPLRATDPHISIVGHIVRTELVRNLSETDAAGGLGNRFIWLCVRRSKMLPEGGSMDQGRFLHLADELRGILGTARAIGTVKRNAEATEIWRATYPELSEGRPGLLGAMTSRAEAQVMRLALLYALLDQSAEIRAPHLMAGLALWQYAQQSALFIFGDRLGDPIGDAIVGALRLAPDGLSRTDLNNLFGRNQPTAAIGRALTTLSGLGLAKKTTIQTPGRSAEIWVAS